MTAPEPQSITTEFAKAFQKIVIEEVAPPPAPSPLDTQVGGGHYKTMKIQPYEFSMANNLNACQHSVIKYVTRKKGDLNKRLEDLDKAIHTIEIYKQLLKDGKVTE